jgi:hypothetical protein
MAIRKSSNSGIPFGNTASRPSSPSTGQPYFNGELQRLELYTGVQYGWQNIVAETPGVTGYTGTVSESSGGTITITGTNFASGATAALIGSDGTEYIATTTTVNNLSSITAVIPAIPGNKEPYDIRVTNPSNLYGVYYDALTVNDSPIWFTASGSLGTFVSAQSISVTVNATDDESNTITYSSSNLPVWLSLNSSAGTLTGTAPTNPTNQTYTFTINASDGINTQVSRSFSITVNAVVVISGGTLSSDSTYYYRTFISNGTFSVSNGSLTADVLAIAGGGGGGTSYFGGGGAGGVRYDSSQSLSTSYNITVGGGGPANSNGVNSQFGSLTAAVGGGTAITAGGSGGGNGRDGNGTPGSGTPGQGNTGGQTTGGSYRGGGGGGGAGAAGGAGGGGTQSGEFGGPGGSGTNTFSSWLSAITPQMTGVSGWSTATSGGYIAGGGGGGTEAGARSGRAAGGAGGGGYGNNGNVPGEQGTVGVENTGGGGGAIGGGGGGFSAIDTSKAGGKGIVIVRYTKSQVGG